MRGIGALAVALTMLSGAVEAAEAPVRLHAAGSLRPAPGSISPAERTTE
jgi:hypothetical protein